MAPLRDKLIHVLASLVAIDLAIAGVVIDARSGSAATTTVSAGKAPVTRAGSVVPRAGGILGGATFRHRRGSGGTTASTLVGNPTEYAAGLPASGTSPTSSGPGPTGSTATTGRSRATGGSAPTGAANGQGGRGTTPTGGGSTGAATAPTGDQSATDPIVTGGDGPTGTTTPTDGGTGTTTPTSAPGSTPPSTKPPAKGPASLTLTDRTGDTVTDSSGAAMAQPHADLVKVQANWTAKALVLAAQVAQPVNPGQDPNWASDSTYIAFDIDTNGDGAPDFEAQYYFDPKTGVVAEVSKAGDTSPTSSVCAAEAGYTADGYTVALDPACLGNPATVAFRVTTYYDPDPANPNGELATDTTPDGGLSGPVSKP